MSAEVTIKLSRKLVKSSTLSRALTAKLSGNIPTTSEAKLLLLSQETCVNGCFVTIRKAGYGTIILVSGLQTSAQIWKLLLLSSPESGVKVLKLS